MKAKFIEMRARGISYEQIARVLNVAPVTLYRWQKALRSPLDARAKTEREKIIEKYRLSENDRLAHWCERYHATLESLEDLPQGDAKAPVLTQILLAVDKRISRTIALDFPGEEGEHGR
jgi:transposase